MDAKLKNDIADVHDAESKISKDQSDESIGIDQYPEGGRDAVMTVVGALLSNFVQFGVVNLIGPLQAHYSANQLKGMSESKISWIGTFLLFFYFFTAAPIGRVFDSTGPTVLLTVGSVLTVFGLMMVSLCKEYYQFFLAEGLILGVGTALVFYPALNAIAHFYSKKRGTMMGLTTAGSSIGAIVFPIAFNKLIPTVGFPWAVRIIGFICLALLVPMVLLIKSRLPRREFGGLSSVIDFSGLRETTYTLFVVGAMITGLGLYNPYFYSQTFSEDHGYSDNVSDYIVAIMNAGSLFGRIIPGIIADRFGVVTLMAFLCTCSAVILLCWIAVSGPAGLIIWGIFYGFCSGSFLSLAPACIARFTTDMTAYGGRCGVFFGMISFATLVSAPIAGALLDHDSGSFNHMIIFSGVVYLAGAVFFWAARISGNSRLMVTF
ncbi:hypothetical protein EIP91_002744 [Steccherinum ochraceum]|uniref:Major facilitator superfamily (MFS) profile domain-containing protein n=1 Tax=Steccherinum ochraceum TaxID=92696 RepID=A0A4R0RBI7_9APHY|nr:hypothetical protein EIP91_002744 [Steccherinum ochraceum]